MKTKELISELSNSHLTSFQDPQVLVKVQGGLYYPIIKVYKEKSGEIVILCRDVTSISAIEPAKWAKGK